MSVSSISPRINFPSISATSSLSRPESKPEVRSPGQSGVQSPFARDCFQSGGCKGGPELTGGVDKAQTPEQMKKMLGQVLGKLLEQLGFKREDIDQALKALGMGGEQAGAAGEAGAGGACGAGGAGGAGEAGGAAGAGGCGAPSAGGAEGDKAMSLEELIKLLMQNPELLKQLMQNPQLLQQLMQNPEAAQQSSKSSSPMGELSGLSRFTGSQSLQLAA
jgi:hypothetical protein